MRKRVDASTACVITGTVLAMLINVYLWAAGVPGPKAPKKWTTKDLAGKYFDFTYGGARCGINFYANGAYNHYLTYPTDKDPDPEWRFMGDWVVIDGTLVLHESADGGTTWRFYYARLPGGLMCGCDDQPDVTLPPPWGVAFKLTGSGPLRPVRFPGQKAREY